MKLIGAGFGRTGTRSLKEALEQLGFQKCYHMVEVFENPSHLLFWKDVSLGYSIDWKTLFLGYESTVDWPACNYYRELMQIFPDAKVLLSVRDPKSWYESAFNSIYQSSKAGIVPPRPGLQELRPIMDQIVWKNTFDGRFGEKDYAIEVYQKHIETVKQEVPKERLLVYEVKQGWEPLCSFLDVPIPEGTPFPYLNTRKEFQERLENLKKTKNTS